MPLSPQTAELHCPLHASTGCSLRSGKRDLPLLCLPHIRCMEGAGRNGLGEQHLVLCAPERDGLILKQKALNAAMWAVSCFFKRLKHTWENLGQ